MVTDGAPPQPMEQNTCPSSNIAETSRVRRLIGDSRYTGLQFVKTNRLTIPPTGNRPNKLIFGSTVCNFRRASRLFITRIFDRHLNVRKTSETTRMWLSNLNRRLRDGVSLVVLLSRRTNCPFGMSCADRSRLSVHLLSICL